MNPMQLCGQRIGQLPAKPQPAFIIWGKFGYERASVAPIIRRIEALQSDMRCIDPAVNPGSFSQSNPRVRLLRVLYRISTLGSVIAVDRIARLRRRASSPIRRADRAPQ